MPNSTLPDGVHGVQKQGAEAGVGVDSGGLGGVQQGSAQRKGKGRQYKGESKGGGRGKGKTLGGGKNRGGKSTGRNQNLPELPPSETDANSVASEFQKS